MRAALVVGPAYSFAATVFVLKLQIHIAMRNARIVINIADSLKPERFVKPQRVGLRTELNAGDASL